MDECFVVFVLTLLYSGAEKALAVVAVLGLLAAFLVVAAHWKVLPDRVATNFDLTGRPNG